LKATGSGVLQHRFFKRVGKRTFFYGAFLLFEEGFDDCGTKFDRNGVTICTLISGEDSFRFFAALGFSWAVIPFSKPVLEFEYCLQVTLNPLKDTELILYGGEYYNGDKVRRSRQRSCNASFLYTGMLFSRLLEAKETRPKEYSSSWQ
jgi:hypothetical protein